jgi:hypothetical protein
MGDWIWLTLLLLRVYLLLAGHCDGCAGLGQGDTGSSKVEMTMRGACCLMFRGLGSSDLISPTQLRDYTEIKILLRRVS